MTTQKRKPCRVCGGDGKGPQYIADYCGDQPRYEQDACRFCRGKGYASGRRPVRRTTR